MKTALYLLTVPVLAIAVPGQSSGPFVGSPHFLTVDSSTRDTSGSNPLPSNNLLRKGAGINASNPMLPFPTPGLPNLRAVLGQGGDIDGISGGLDWVQADNVGVHVAPPLGIGTLTFSVTRGTMGPATGNGSVIRAEFNAADGAAGDLFSFVLPGSTLAPPTWREVTMRAQNSTEINLFAPGHPGNITGHDLFLSALQEPQLVAQILPIFTGLYFSVSKGTINAVPVAWWGGTTPSGATILWAKWTHDHFESPQPFLRFDQLGLAAGDDVIALAYDTAQRHLLFATDRDDIDPLMFAHLDATGTVTNVSTYRDAGGQPISDKIGVSIVRRDKIDAICALDPYATVKQGFSWGGFFGFPDASIASPLVNPALTATAFSDRQTPEEPESIVTCLSGWPGDGPVPSLAVGFLADPTYKTIITFGIYNRTPGDPNDGAVQQRLPLPRIGIRMGLHWAVLGGNLLEQAPPAWIEW